jgi:hypothetical protein
MQYHTRNKKLMYKCAAKGIRISMSVITKAILSALRARGIKVFVEVVFFAGKQ